MDDKSTMDFFYEGKNGDLQKERRTNPEWYSIKQIYEMIQNMNRAFVGMEKELLEFRHDIRRYNGLKEDNQKQWVEMARLAELIRETDMAPCKKLGAWESLETVLDGIESELKDLKDVHTADVTLRSFFYKWGGWLVGALAALKYIQDAGWF